MISDQTFDKTKAFLDFFIATDRTTVEFYVEGLGWLIILKENIEVVSDNWFASSMFLASECTMENVATLSLKNVYRLNTTFNENANNVKYNLVFDKILLFADKIVAYH
jgi:hypothetical protein